MDIRQTRMLEDLAGVFRGSLRCDALTTSLYATDGSLHQIVPLAVACPVDRDDLVTLVRYAAEQKLPVVARGSGSSVGGEPLGAGIIVDFARHLRTIEDIGESTVRVQSGVIHSQLNRVLAQRGRCFAPDPSNSITTTVGSMLALDAAGAHSPRVGTTRDHVVSMDVILANGHSLLAEVESLESFTGIKPPPTTTTPRHQQGSGPNDSVGSEAVSISDSAVRSGIKHELVHRLIELLGTNAELIDARQPATLPRNRAGYCLRGVLTAMHLHLPRLLVGSEGTLGLFAAATLRTSALPSQRAAMLVAFGSLDSAVKAVSRIAPDKPSACDLVDRRILTLARDTDVRFEQLIPPGAEAAILVEHVAFSERELRDKLDGLTKRLADAPDTIAATFLARTEEELSFVWSLPHQVVPLLNGVRSPKQSPLPIVEDITVPPEKLEEFVVRMRTVLQRHEVTASFFSHATAGQLHIRPFLPTPTLQDGPRIEAFARDLYHAALALGGSISGEHGLGLSRTAFLRSQYGELYRVFQQVKEIFDPQNRLNPGKILSDDPRLTIRNFRPTVNVSRELYDLQLKWSPPEMSAVAASCHGCGTCRTQEPHGRMCPFFRETPAEEHSPRAKANGVRAVFDGRLPPHDLDSPEMLELARSCFHCQQCRLECPNHVDVPRIVSEIRAQHLETHGAKTSEWFLAHLHVWGDWLCRASLLINPLLGWSTSRWLAEKLLGIAAQRKLPRFAKRSFIRSASKEWLAPPKTIRDGLPVVYFVDHFANYHDPELAFAFTRIMELHGVPVHVPPKQQHSGMALIAMGDMEGARSLAERNVTVLAEFAREGCPIVCTEPTAALCLKHEYPRLIDNPDATFVADRVIEAGSFLSQLHQAGKLNTDFAPVSHVAAYHTPCHLRALGPTTPLVDLCRLIPQLEPHPVETGCSGLAGTFGLQLQHFEKSLAIGHGLIEEMRSSRYSLGLTECSGCRIQMEQRSPIPTLHPLKVLALAYGLMPNLERTIRPTPRKRVLS